MKNPLWPRMFIAAVSLIFATGAAKAELMVGDKAPKLQVGKWIQGEPVQAFDTNHIYIIEFWATWCGPCVQSIPHLNALWQTFKDEHVIVIGQDVWDSDDAVAPFVKKMGTNMTYRVALDDKSQDPDGFMNSNWWKRKVDDHGIPTAFIINQDGIVAWIGHPMALKEQVLNDVVSGHYDLAKATVEYKKAWEENKKSQALQKELFSAMDNKKWDDAESALNKITEIYPESKGLTALRLKVLLGQKKFDQAYQFADSFSAANSTNEVWQNELAWEIATSEVPDERCLGLAQRLAERGVQLTNGKNAGVLDTLARVQFMLGKKEAAITTEEKAVNIESSPREKASLEKTLAGYREDKLPKVE